MLISHAGACFPGTEHLGSLVSWFSIKETHLEALGPSCCTVSSRIYPWSLSNIVGKAITMLSQPPHWRKSRVCDLSAWPQRNIERLPQMGKGQSMCKEWRNPRTNTQLFGCSWIGATLISVRRSFSKLNKGKRRAIFLKTVA